MCVQIFLIEIFLPLQSISVTEQNLDPLVIVLLRGVDDRRAVDLHSVDRLYHLQRTFKDRSRESDIFRKRRSGEVSKKRHSIYKEKRFFVVFLKINKNYLIQKSHRDFHVYQFHRQTKAVLELNNSLMHTLQQTSKLFISLKAEIYEIELIFLV